MSLLTLEASIKSHLVAVVLVVGLCIGSVYGVNALIASHDAKNDAKWAAVIAANDAKSRADEATLESLVATVTAQNAALSQQILQRNAALSAVVAADKTLTSQQTATKLGGTAPDPTTVSLPLDTARNITTQLDMLPVVEANLATETQIAANDQKVIDSDAVVITDLKTSLANYEPVDKPCQAQIKTIKANARKSKLRWFLFGFIVGRASTIVVPNVAN
jgi:hypothetical protein